MVFSRVMAPAVLVSSDFPMKDRSAVGGRLSRIERCGYLLGVLSSGYPRGHPGEARRGQAEIAENRFLPARRGRRADETRINLDYLPKCPLGIVNFDYQPSYDTARTR